MYVRIFNFMYVTDDVMIRF